MTRQTLTQRRILELWATSPGSRTKHRQTELKRLVKRDLRAAARRNVRAKARAA